MPPKPLPEDRCLFSRSCDEYLFHHNIIITTRLPLEKDLSPVPCPLRCSNELYSVLLTRNECVKWTGSVREATNHTNMLHNSEGEQSVIPS